MIFDKFFARFSEPKGDFEQGSEINQATKKRNLIATLSVLLSLSVVAVGFWAYVKESQTPIQQVPEQEVAFGAVVTDDFTDRDNQSALTNQQLQIDAMNKVLKKFEGTLESFNQTLTTGLGNIGDAAERNSKATSDKLKEEWEQEIQEVKRLKEQLTAQLTQGQLPPEQQTSVNGQGSTFGDYRYPPAPTSQYSDNNPNEGEFSYKENQRNPVDSAGFETQSFHWQATIEEAKSLRTTDNYVPTGTFVTAVVTGGADANAGVSGQGDTAPIVFQTINSGVLPNGKKSKLNNCTITGSVYGEISASRGITRTNRMSCIQPDGSILDIPVKATAFNFGRNGIRGTTILKNGKIVQMAGVSGILTGLGETGKALSQTTTPTALGPSQSVNGEDALVNLLGNATSSVGSKLADYYIKLAELYHPIVEVNPGAIVNIVFLEGFPLDPLLAEEYEAEVKKEEQAAMNTPQNQLMSVLTNSPAMTAGQAVNPLAEKMAQEGIPASQFGSAQ
ncbi:TraB/VirB10 family protein [Vibrio europaeus]|uniref:TrbI/VirB10 family protein n=1 Tax=Vibrio europaeus TaxID=300876 RepID=UPI0023424B16|nr:TrbI/VirB10 family protein [Vibrio europaeus]MDC5841117.1 TraB/VirB10 family protein [Vibrio europaeus]